MRTTTKTTTKKLAIKKATTKKVATTAKKSTAKTAMKARTTKTGALTLTNKSGLATKKAVSSKTAMTRKGATTKTAAPTKKAATKTTAKKSVATKKTTTPKKAWDFKLTDRNGKSYSLNSWKGKYTVLYFYPKDDTPGCTVEAIEFQGAMPKYKKAKVEVVGISGGNDKTKTAFCKKHKLALTLLSDTNFKVAKAYGAYGKKSFMGRTYSGILRKTYLLDSSKNIVKVWDTVKPETHAKEVLDYISKM